MPALTACSFLKSRGLPPNTDEDPLLRGDVTASAADLLHAPSAALLLPPPPPVLLSSLGSVLLIGNVNTGDARRRGVVDALTERGVNGPAAEPLPLARRSQETAADGRL